MSTSLLYHGDGLDTGLGTGLATSLKGFWITQPLMFPPADTGEWREPARRGRGLVSLLPFEEPLPYVLAFPPERHLPAQRGIFRSQHGGQLLP